MKLWDKGHPIKKEVEDFTVGNDYLLDYNLVKYDCIASIAHAKTLEIAGILTENEGKKLETELNKIIILDERKKFIIKKEEEDCHTAIENHLTKNLGDLGKKIHTGRSRNDQVLAAIRLYSRAELLKTKKYAEEIKESLFLFEKKFGKIILPGYTHTRKAMPSSIKMWAEGYAEAIDDDIMLIDNALVIIDKCPLGTGAGYGIPIELDRNYTAKELKFSKIQNPIAAQLSRGKYESIILNALSQIMFDLNRISSDLILFSLEEFGFYELPKEYCTGSSIMPQKKNPDVLELIRAKYHIVQSFEFQIKSITSNLISGYHRDFQLTKQPLIDGFKITQESLSIISSLILNLKVNEKNCQKAMTNDLFATEQAYKLVKKGMPFRDAYKVIGKKYS